MTTATLDIARDFSISGEPLNAQPIVSGHINDTYVVRTNTNQRYIMQRINHAVFRDPCGLMNNVLLVTQFMKERLAEAGQQDADRRVLQVVPHRDGAALLETASGDYWRMYRYIEDSHAVGDIPSLSEIHPAAFGFGRFTSLLATMPTGGLVETISKFHHGPRRYGDFLKSVQMDAANRVKDTKREIEFIQQHENLLARPQQMLESGELSWRVAHNDAKSNNVLLDDQTNEALCVIDLDTVMPGLALFDFGDLVRTTSAIAAEDERDLDKVQVDLARLKLVTQGFLAGTQDSLTRAERASLVLGPSYMTLIMATRFLTDHLQGDTYYRIHRPNHNLDRCRAQIALIRELLIKEDELSALLDERNQA